VDVLVTAGADINAKDNQGNSVASIYVPGANASRLEALKRHGLKPDANETASLLMNAIWRHSTDEVQALLQKGVDPNGGAKDQSAGISVTPLTIAISTAEFGIADMLRKAGAKDVGVFSQAAAMGDLAQMKTLLDAGADVNELSVIGNTTPLSFAVRRGQLKAVEFLLDHGANINLF